MVIGFGNPLRGDDGAGPAVAEAVGRARPDVPVYAVHQLLPELAQPIASARVVVFVDVTARGSLGSDPGVRPHAPGTVACRAVGPVRTGAPGHALSPSGLLFLARELYGISPSAHIVTIQGHSFEHGDTLSVEVATAVAPTTSLVLSLLAQAAEMGSDPGV